MIPEPLHRQVFEQARKGKRFEIQINKVPGQPKYNSYCMRQGYITDLKVARDGKGFRITHACVKLRVDGLGRAQLFRFPIEHITLMHPPPTKTYDDELDVPLGQTPIADDDLGDWAMDPEDSENDDDYPEDEEIYY